MTMAHHHKLKQQHPERKQAGHSHSPVINTSDRILEVVVKGDTGDAVEAVVSSLLGLSTSECRLVIISRGVGDVNKNDLLAAATGSRLILGFNVEVLPHIAEECRLQTIEVRLYTVIYTLIEDIRRLVSSLIPIVPTETVTGNAQVIALFKSSRKGIIIGCQVLDGKLRTGDAFRLISAMGPVYSSTINSLHIERNTVTQALPGQQVGIKLPDFKKVSIGDIVECYKESKTPARKEWKPSGTVTIVTKVP